MPARDTQTDSFDHLIVGAGAAGCVLANRLSVDPAVSVCLIEAGPTDGHPLVSIPLASFRTEPVALDQALRNA